jgi:hypothetical protein
MVLNNPTSRCQISVLDVGSSELASGTPFLTPLFSSKSSSGHFTYYHMSLYTYVYIHLSIYIYIISMENQPFIDVKTNVLPIFRCTGHHRSSQLRPGCRTVAEIIVVSHHGSTGRPTCERPGSRCHEGDRSDRGEENSQGMIHDFI